MSGAPGARWYNAVWRWHFYAALIAVPFILWLATTGSLYLWKPQIEAMLEARYDSLPTTGPRLAPEAQVRAALGAVPGSTLHRYQLPRVDGEAVRVIVNQQGRLIRTYVDPRSGAVLGRIAEEDQPMRILADLHGTLLAGKLGSWLVEIAACWAIVMLLTGLYLWWPRKARGLGGVLYPRLRRGSRVLWRDLHAVTGIWVSAFALFLIVTGLPWANAWGSYFKQVRTATGTLNAPQDWTIAGTKPPLDPHAEHGGTARPGAPPAGAELDRVVATVMPMALPNPVLVVPPKAPGDPWKVAAEPANRPQRLTLTVDGATGVVERRERFADKHWIDRAVGTGIAAHEGQLFGLANQLLGTLTAALLITLAVSGTVMWWRRRPLGVLGAPAPRARPSFGPVLIALVLLLALLMPLFGLTLALVLLAERIALRHLPRARHWLGLGALPA